MLFYLFLFSIILLLFLFIYFLFKDKFQELKQIHFYFLFLSFFLVIISIFSFSKEIFKNTKNQSSNIVFVLDVSKSMLAIDYNKTISRLKIWKNFIESFILKNPQNKYSLTIFAWDINQVLPLTNDLNLFFTILSWVDEKSILKWWTNLSEAIIDSINRFKNEENGWAIIILSDFELTNTNEIEKQKYIKNLEWLKEKLTQKNIKIVNIWLWNKNWNKIIEWYDPFFWITVYKKDKFNQDIITKFDENFFNNLSALFNSKKYIIYKKDDIDNIISKIDNIPTNENIEQKNYTLDYSRYAIILAYIFFLAYLLLYFLSKRLWK